MTSGPWDLCVLGAGPGGYAAAMRAHISARVVIVERGRSAGAGITPARFSSKTMWHLSNDYAVAARTIAVRAHRRLGRLVPQRHRVRAHRRAEPALSGSQLRDGSPSRPRTRRGSLVRGSGRSSRPTRSR